MKLIISSRKVAFAGLEDESESGSDSGRNGLESEASLSEVIVLVIKILTSSSETAIMMIVLVNTMKAMLKTVMMVEGVSQEVKGAWFG